MTWPVIEQLLPMSGGIVQKDSQGQADVGAV